MGNTMSKYEVENGGVRPSGPNDNSGAGTSGPDDNSGVGTSDHEDISGVCTSDPEDNSGVGTSDHENISGVCTSDPEKNSGTSTNGYVNIRVAGTSGPEDRSGACTRGPVDSSVAVTSGPEDSSRAVTSGSVTDPVPPMSDTENWFIEKRIDDIANKYEYDVSKRGKWILFFAIDQMNEMWVKACRLYTEGQLVGIQYIRTSTAKEIKPDGGAIRFYCGPYGSERLVKSYGRNVVSLMNYWSRLYGFISFKTDEQTLKGTRKWMNYIYRVQAPRKSRESLDGPLNDSEAEILKPMSVLDRAYMADIKMDIHDLNECDRTLRGRWTLACLKDTLDDAWRESCTLYRQGKLPGVQSLGTNTGQTIPPFVPKDRKLIFFHCGPCSNRNLMMEYGRNIARQLGHFSATSHIGYKILDDETRHSLGQPWDTFFYLLNVDETQ